MDCKLTINIATGHLEVEGSESLVKEIYKDFKEFLSQSSAQLPFDMNLKYKNQGASDENSGKGHKPKNNSKMGGAQKPKNSNELKVLTDLNLRPRGKTSLKDYAASFEIKNAEELTLLIVYYLKEELKEKVSINHIFTCFKELKKKIPQHFRQTLTNQKNSKNWIDVSDWEDIKYTVPGMNHMEHDFSKASGNGK